MACQWISLWLSPSQFGSFLTAPTISVYTGVLLGSFYAVYRNSHNVELVRSLFWSCASVRRKRRRSGRWISSTIIYLTHIHGRGRGSYLVITSSFVFGNLLLRFLSSWLLLRRIRSCVEWEMGWFWDMGFRGFVRCEWEEEGGGWEYPRQSLEWERLQEWAVSWAGAKQQGHKHFVFVSRSRASIIILARRELIIARGGGRRGRRRERGAALQKLSQCGLYEESELGTQ